MATVSTKFAEVLTKLVFEMMADKKNEISAGMLDHETYKFRCGELHGMELVLEQFDEAHKIVDQR